MNKFQYLFGRVALNYRSNMYLDVAYVQLNKCKKHIYTTKHFGVNHNETRNSLERIEIDDGQKMSRHRKWWEIFLFQNKFEFRRNAAQYNWHHLIRTVSQVYINWICFVMQTDVVSRITLKTKIG